MRKLLYWLPFLATGPITGPLAEGVFRNWRTGHRVLAALYLIAAAETVVLLPLILGRLLNAVGAAA